ncbi:hypothetical protein EVJ32_04790 [Exiguobacterium sp. SH5S4]|uniref:hypothetical protein n=1 Tax=Exiguobacterium sp. SH5S4 TaxID=2510961 RepID=UPI00103F877A|nr:hypothetical protein [Exiguobacterium sp. SH5S4]TCI26694.1 hypothetical protein EVJ32_04790 [Exiguobacterium sp. SH5S4]
MITAFKTNILSSTYPTLKKFNKKQQSRKDLRMGDVVETDYGVGIVTNVDKDSYNVAVKPTQDRYGWESQYCVAKDSVMLSDVSIDPKSKLHRGAWMIIEDSAKYMNQKYEIEKGKAVFLGLEWKIEAKREERLSRPGAWGQKPYRRYTGVNPKGQSFDFELCVASGTYFGYADKVMYALGLNDGYISHLDGTGWVVRRQIVDHDVNHGLCINI